MKIYTRGGDDGTTGLLGGGRAPKDSPRVAAIGALDELSAVLGWAAVVCAAPLQQTLCRVQGELFEIGARLAAAGPQSPPNLPPLVWEMVQRLEGEIDRCDASLPALRQFILPGGTEAAGRLHLCRAVCRRTERAVVRLAAAEPVDRLIPVYLNRLSDWLFVQARQANQEAGVADVPWTPFTSDAEGTEA